MLAAIWKKWVRNSVTGRKSHAPRAFLRLESCEDRVTPAGLAAVGSTPGVPALVTLYDATTQAQLYTISPFPGFTGGVSVALGDVNGDGTSDVIVGAGPGGGPIVNVYNGVDGAFLKSFVVGDAGSRAGASVAASDIDQDGLADVITGAIRNGQPLVQLLRFSDGTAIRSYTPFTGAQAVNVAAGDVNGDGTPDVIAASGPGIASAVVAYSGTNETVLRSFNPFESTFLGGVHVAAGDVTGDGKADIIVAAATLGGPRVSVYSGLNGIVTANFFAYGSGLRDGAFAVAWDANATGNLDLVSTNGPNNLPDPKAFDATTTAQITATLLPGLPISTSYDTIAPTVVLSTTATNPTGTTPIPFTATFSEAVSGFTSAGLTVVNGAAGSVTRVDAKTYTFSITPAGDGTVSVTVNAGAAWDAADNRNTASAASSITFDGTAPTVTANDQTTSVTTPTLTGTVNDSAATVQVLVDGQTFAALVSGNAWSATVPTPLADGTFVVTATATDTLGNTADATASLTIDTLSPTPTVGSTATDPTGTSPIPFQIVFDEDVQGFDQTDLTIVNGSVATFTAVDAQTYDVTITPAFDGPVSVSVAAGQATDAAGNANLASNTLTIVYDTGPITVTADPLTTNNPTPTLTGTVSDPTSTVTITVDSQTFAAVVAGTTWTATVPSALADGTYDIQVDAVDPLANTGTTTLTGGLVVDTTAPTVDAITANPSSGTFGETDSIDLTVNLSEPATLAGGGFFLLLDTGATVSLTQSGSDPAQYIGTYVVAAGENSADLDTVSLSLESGATLTDALGNAADLTISLAASLAANADVVIDTVP